MLNPITIRYPFPPARRSLAAAQVADLFGLDYDIPAHLIAENVTFDFQPGDLVLFTGPSGSGKSSLMREAGRQLGAVDIMATELPNVPLVEVLSGNLEARLATLAACGLSEARLLLRTPAELSDGQRYRFRLAFACSRTQADDTQPKPASPGFLLADEFAAMLDRPLAKVVAMNLRKLVTRSGVGVLCATTHDDVTEDLNPDVWVHCHGEGRIEVDQRDVKKKRSASRTSFGSRTAPEPTGRSSHGGIIAATTSLMCAG